MSQFVTCEVDGYALCVPIAAIQEINRVRDITKMHRAPRYISGLLNLRGRVVTMIDLGVRLGMTDTPKPTRQQNIVLKRTADLQRLGFLDADSEGESQDEIIGLAVDAVGDVVDVDDGALCETPANLDPEHAAFLSGVARVNGAIHAILDIATVSRPAASAALELSHNH